MKSHHKMIIAGAAGLAVLAIVGAPVWSSAPLLAVLVLCPVMMFFMMRGVAQGTSHGGDGDGDDPSDPGA